MIAGVARACLLHPWRMRALLLALFLGGLAGIFFQPRFASEILDLLPASSPAVQGLRAFYGHFEQSRELALVVRAHGDPELVADFADFLGTRLSAAPWVVRWLEGSPLQNQLARETLPKFAVPLLLQLPPQETAALIAGLEREALGRRFAGIAERLRMGSPSAQAQWQLDPLGLYGSALAPVLDTTAAERTFAPQNASGDMRIFTLLTNQPDLSEAACQSMLQTVRTFLQQARQDYGVEGDSALEILITGRSAYVAEIAASMRRDISLTSVVSLLSIGLLFWLVYRRLSLLFGLACILVVCSVLAMALGLTIFPALSLLAVAFCSILFGLGQDFGLLLNQEARLTGVGGRSEEAVEQIAGAIRRRWPGIAWVATTTALGFLALLLSESPGFAQLGVLTALGVLLAALLVPIFFFAFMPRKMAQATGASVGEGWFVGLLRPSRAYGVGVGVLLLVATGVVLSPWRSLRFDLRPSSLEPHDLPAAQALQEILRAFPDSAEPSLVLLPLTEGKSGLSAAESALALEDTLRRWQNEGRLASFAVGSRLLPSPQASQNLKLWRAVNWAEVENNLLQQAVAAGLQIAPDSSLREQLTALQALSTREAECLPPHLWRGFLPEASPWWFVLDRLLALPPQGTGYLAAYFQPQPGANPAAWQEELQQEFPGAVITGWSVTVQSLVGWAERELRLFAFGVTGVIALVLLLVYRSPVLWGIHLLGLAAAALLFLAALKGLNLPINLLAVLGFPLLVGVGVDYSTHLLLALREHARSEWPAALSRVATPVLLAGLTTMAGFGALGLAANPSLRGLGVLCALGVGICLLSAFGLVLPLAARLFRKS